MTNTVFTEEMQNKLMTKLRWRIVPYIMLLYVVSMMDRLCISFGALQMNKELGISASAFGIIAGIFFISYFFFEVPSNVIMHKVGARVWITRILVTWGIVTIGTGFSETVTHLAIWRFLLGVAEAGFYPCMILYLTLWFPAKHLGRTISLFMCGMAISNILTGPLSTWIMDNVTWFGMSGWRWMFIIEGIPAVILGITTFFVLTDRPEQAKFLTPEEKAWLIAELHQEHEAKNKKLQVSKWAVFSQPRVWYMCIPYLCYIMALYGLGMWVPQILRALSQTLTNFQIGLISTLPYIVGVIAMILVARHSDKTLERRYHIGIPILFSFFSLIALTMTKDLWLSMLFICISTAGIYSFVGTYWTLPSSFLSEGTAAVGIGIINSVGNLGGFFGPYAVGYLKDMTGSTSAGMYVLAAFALFATISVLAIPAKEVELRTQTGNIKADS
ncbi:MULTISPECIES: MFS transporter [Sporomusa]|uniref:MFS transporter n=1 Tax=Sporomusa TaxID=2375 RepID=UPI003158EC9B